MINALAEIETARQMVADGKMKPEDYEALLIGLSVAQTNYRPLVCPRHGVQRHDYNPARARYVCGSCGEGKR